MICVTDLEFRYPQSDFCLRVANLEVRQGVSAAIIGPSGGGKTTLLNLIAGILEPSSGRVTVGDVALSTLSPAARRAHRVRHIGLVFQEFELLDHLNVLDNILLPCRLTSALRVDGRIRERAAGLAAEMGIADKLRRYVRKLSQGERQRVALCRALLLEPPLLLCDEPTGNLDPTNKHHVLDILFAYASRTSTTMLTVTHDYELLPRFEQTIDLKQLAQAGENDG